MKAMLTWLLALGLLCAGCSSVDTRKSPRADFSRIKRVYVERRLADDHHLDRLIVQELQRLGLEASAGPLTMMPDGVDAVVTYSDEWAWDFKTYLTYLTIQVRDYRTDASLGQGVSRHASPFTKTPDRMIRGILEPLFK